MNPGKEIPSAESRKIMVDLLQDIHLFCEKKHIRYHLVSGSLIGAIRHKGFIPWDDDLDIAMPRPDFERFRQEYNHPYFQFISARESIDYPLDYAKVHDTRTCIMEEGGDDVNWGIFIDVFPVDGIPSLQIAQKRIRVIQFVRHIAANQRFTRHYQMGRQHSFKKNLRILLGKIAHAFLSLNRILLWEDSLMKKYDFDNSEYSLYLPFNPVVIVKREDIERTIPWTFEGIQVNVPQAYDKWLTQLYGDYMTPPPPEKRVSLHGIKAFWK